VLLRCLTTVAAYWFL